MINVLFCGNDKVFDGILTCMLSIFKRTKTTEPFNFYIFTMDVSHIKPEYICISDEQVQFLSDVAKKQNPENKITKVDVTDLYNKEFANSRMNSAIALHTHS